MAPRHQEIKNLIGPFFIIGLRVPNLRFAQAVAHCHGGAGKIRAALSALRWFILGIDDFRWWNNREYYQTTSIRHHSRADWMATRRDSLAESEWHSFD